MPRAARVILPNYPHHIIQRGHNRSVVFTTDEDYLYYLENLKEWKKELDCKIYAYCLMTNHIHLIVACGEKVENLGLLMKRVAGRQTRYVNKLEGRRGTLWESRFKSSPIEIDEYLLACCRYIELNPVRARIVDNPGQYKWSSYRFKVGGEEADWIDLDPCYQGLGTTDREREERYKEWVQADIPEEEFQLIQQGIQREQLTGTNRFIEEVAGKIGRRIEFRGQGRPKREKNKSVPIK